MKEQELFTLLKEYMYPDLVKSEGMYDSFDCISELAGHFIELKCRHTHYPTLLVEEMKYRNLIRQAEDLGLIPIYINSTPEGVYSFDLLEIPEPEWFTHLMPATTEFDNTEKIEKLVGYLPIKESVKI